MLRVKEEITKSEERRKSKKLKGIKSRECHI